MKTQTFLILQGRQRSHVFEMVMESSRVSLISSEHPLTPLPIPVW